MSSTPTSPETCDVVVIGSRCAGSATGIALARNGRRVITLDRTHFPSDTLSTHLLFPAGVAELARLGALERVRALDPPEHRELLINAEGAEARERYTPVEGIDYGMCVPRPLLDQALVATARGHGVEVREGATVQELVWKAGRAGGVRYQDAEGETRTIEASLVIGADGRRSKVAKLVGAKEPYRSSRNERYLAFRYMDDPRVGTPWRHVPAQWRVGDTHGMCFSCPDDRMVVLFMGPTSKLDEFRQDAEGTWERLLAANPNLGRRVAGATNPTKLRHTDRVPAFFRRSSGRGWALTGDAGHFKDPVIAQGIRDALRFGRLLGEAAGPALGDPRRLDHAVLAAERRRDSECQATYHWGNRESRARPSSPLTQEVVRAFGRSAEPDLTDTFGRMRRPERVIGLRRQGPALAKALLRRDSQRGALLREAREELLIDLDIQRERWLGSFRDPRPALSERR